MLRTKASECVLGTLGQLQVLISCYDLTNDDLKPTDERDGFSMAVLLILYSMYNQSESPFHRKSTPSVFSGYTLFFPRF